MSTHVKHSSDNSRNLLELGKLYFYLTDVHPRYAGKLSRLIIITNCKIFLKTYLDFSSAGTQISGSKNNTQNNFETENKNKSREFEDFDGWVFDFHLMEYGVGSISIWKSIYLEKKKKITRLFVCTTSVDTIIHAKHSIQLARVLNSLSLKSLTQKENKWGRLNKIPKYVQGPLI